MTDEIIIHKIKVTKNGVSLVYLIRREDPHYNWRGSIERSEYPRQFSGGMRGG